MGMQTTVTGDRRRVVVADTVNSYGIFHDIVVGVDGSGPAHDALELALRLRAFDSHTRVLSVAEVHHALQTGLEAAQWTNWIRGAAQEIRDEYALELEQLSDTSVRTVEGRAADVLLRELRQGPADLVAVGAGRGGRAAGVLFGSTATRIARESPCSVLIARGERDSALSPQRIIVGVDGSQPAADAEAVAFALADSLGAEVRRVMATGGEHFYADRMVRAELDARRPVEVLVDASRDADLLVVGSRGLRGLASLGSVAERVAHRAACAVLIVRTPPQHGTSAAS
jgi:nucleotide-binding universal stress UspA family protein